MEAQCQNKLLKGKDRNLQEEGEDERLEEEDKDKKLKEEYAELKQYRWERRNRKWRRND